MRQYDGIAVITGSRVVLLKKRGMNKLKTEMPLHALKSVDVDGEGEVTPHRAELQRLGWRRRRGRLQTAGRPGRLRP